MPNVDEELHGWRRERVVLGEPQLGGEDAALKGRVLGTLDQTLPVEEVVLGAGAGGDAFGRVVGEGAVLLQETAVGGGLGHGLEAVSIAVGRCRLGVVIAGSRFAFLGWQGISGRLSVRGLKD